MSSDTIDVVILLSPMSVSSLAQPEQQVTIDGWLACLLCISVIASQLQYLGCTIDRGPSRALHIAPSNIVQDLAHVNPLPALPC